ncbi:hypothetical protein U1Q18_012295 [Sarracenia purpurea var. burkii]
MRSSSAKAKLKTGLYSWNVMLRTSIEDGSFSQTLKIYSLMVNSVGVRGAGNNFTLPLVFKACAKLGSIRDARKVHSHVFLSGLDADVFVQTALIDVYSKCYDLASSRRVFDEMPHRSIVSWNSMISAYCRHFLLDESIWLLKGMQFLGLEPSSASFVSIVSSCSFASLGRKQGLSIHCYVIKLGLHSDLPLSNSFMSMYVRLGEVDDASCIFDSMSERSIVSWTTILGGYVSTGDVTQLFDTFNRMRRQSINPDCIALVNLIYGCAQTGNLPLASSAHSLALKSGCADEDPIDNLLVSMYAKCGDLTSSRDVFDKVSEKSVFLWTSIISGYTHFGSPNEAITLFKQLLRTSTRPNEITLATILSACAKLGSLSMGAEIEEYILQNGNGLASNLHVQTSLIHMYCKCGSVEKAEAAFERVGSEKDLAIWSAMINGYAVHGMGKEAVSLFEKMQCQEGIKPDAAVYTSILTACSHSGLVEEGVEYFENMKHNFGIEPCLEHYSCIVDLLCRAGYLDLALKTIQDMPMRMQKQAQVWATLLIGCRTHRNIELGEFAVKKLLDLNPATISHYVALTNFYTSMGKWKEAAIVRNSINDRGSAKDPGWSQIETNVSSRVFVAGDHHSFTP